MGFFDHFVFLLVFSISPFHLGKYLKHTSFYSVPDNSISNILGGLVIVFYVSADICSWSIVSSCFGLIFLEFIFDCSWFCGIPEELG